MNKCLDEFQHLSYEIAAVVQKLETQNYIPYFVGDALPRATSRSTLRLFQDLQLILQSLQAALHPRYDL